MWWGCWGGGKNVRRGGGGGACKGAQWSESVSKDSPLTQMAQKSGRKAARTENCLKLLSPVMRTSKKKKDQRVLAIV